MLQARPLASQYPVLKVRAAGRFGAARQGDILPYPGRRGGAIPALHGSYTFYAARRLNQSARPTCLSLYYIHTASR